VSSSPLSLSYLSSSLLSLPDSNAQRTSHGCHHGVSIHAAARRHSHGCSSTAPCPLLANDATAQLARAWPMPATSTSRTASSGRTWPAAARAAQQLLFRYVSDALLLLPRLTVALAESPMPARVQCLRLPAPRI
jgi:hypothetical protein